MLEQFTEGPVVPLPTNFIEDLKKGRDQSYLSKARTET
jgi:hypothetical protein